jgi:mannose-6-phosphate isomerase-like protein (cupin superfamily)
MTLNPNIVRIILSISLLTAFCECTDKNQNQKLETTGFENIQIGGELKVRSNKNFDRLEEDLYQPKNLFWSEKESGGWPADKEGRTILGLVMNARASHRTPKYLSEIMGMLPSHLNIKGYMGTIHPESINEQQLSGHGWLLRGLNEYYEWTKDEKVLAISKMIVDSLFIPITPFVKDYPITEESRITGVGAISGTIQNSIGKWAISSDIGCVFIAMDGLIHAYKNKPDQEIKMLIDELIQLFLRMDLIKIKAQTHASLTGMRGLIRYAEITGDTTLIKEVEKRWTLYNEYFMTKGHYHLQSNRAEFYWGVQGKGMLILMDRERNTWAEEVCPGSLHYIGAEIAHRLANTGEKKLIVGACWPSDAGHDYDEIAVNGFSARLVEVDGKPKLIV